MISMIWVFPLARVFSRVGYSSWWASLALILGVGFVMFWFVAFMPWRIAKFDASIFEKKCSRIRFEYRNEVAQVRLL